MERRPCRVVWVGNLTSEISNDEIYHACIKIVSEEEIVRIKPLLDKNCCFVTCKTVESAKILHQSLYHVNGVSVKTGWGKEEPGDFVDVSNVGLETPTRGLSVPVPPNDPMVQQVIDQLAVLITSKEGGENLEMVFKENEKDNPSFEFLFGGEYYPYFQWKKSNLLLNNNAIPDGFSQQIMTDNNDIEIFQMLNLLDGSKNSLVNVSTYVLRNLDKADQILNCIEKQIHITQDHDKRILYLYLISETLINSFRNMSPASSYWSGKVLERLPMIIQVVYQSVDFIKQKILRIFLNWEGRNIYAPHIIESLRNVLELGPIMDPNIQIPAGILVQHFKTNPPPSPYTTINLQDIDMSTTTDHEETHIIDIYTQFESEMMGLF